MVYFKTWDEIGKRYINDLIQENGNYLTQLEFETLTGIKTNFLQYNGIISSKIKINIQGEMKTKIFLPEIPYS